MNTNTRGRRRRASILAGCLALAGPVLAGPMPTGPLPAQPAPLPTGQMLPAPSAPSGPVFPGAAPAPTPTGPMLMGEPIIQLPPGKGLQVENAPTEYAEETPAGAIKGEHPHHLRADFCTPALVPAPPGHFLYNAFQVETDLAKAERMVIYREEWERGAPAVKYCALHHLELIAEWLRSNCKPYIVYPVRVEPSGDPVVDGTRRLAIVNYLINHGVGDAETRVVLGTGRAEGLQGEWIERVYRQGQFFGTSAPSLFGTGGAASSVFPPSFGFGGYGFRGY